MADRIRGIEPAQLAGLFAMGAAGFPCGVLLVDAAPGEGGQGIAQLFAREDVASIHAHNPAFGRFQARIDRA